MSSQTDYDAGVHQGFFFGVRVAAHLVNDMPDPEEMMNLLAEIADGQLTISKSSAEMFSGFPDAPDEIKKEAEKIHSESISLDKEIAGIVRREMGDSFDKLRRK